MNASLTQMTSDTISSSPQTKLDVSKVAILFYFFQFCSFTSIIDSSSDYIGQDFVEVQVQPYPSDVSTQLMHQWSKFNPSQEATRIFPIIYFDTDITMNTNVLKVS